MPVSDFNVAKLNLAYAKIVAMPTSLGWSQVYNAGNLFAVVSLTLNPELIGAKKQIESETTLPGVGKEIFNSLEAEFFTLEEKNLKNIKEAVEKSFKEIDTNITADACLAYFKDNILYLFITGKGKIFMKREEESETLLQKKDSSQNILSASGYIKQGDIIFLQTDHFAQNVTDDNIIKAFELQLPNDIAESLTPHIHEKEDGSQAAAIIAYNGVAQAQNHIQENIPPVIKEPVIEKASEKFKIPFLSFTYLQKISLLLAFLIFILLAAGVIFVKAQQENAKSASLYKEISAQAQKKYDEGKSLGSLNPDAAQNDFRQAQLIIKQNLDKFKSGSKEKTKLQELLNQIELMPGLGISSANKIPVKYASVEEFDLLNIEKNNKASGFAQDRGSIYLLTQKAITAIDKATGSKKDIIINNNDWADPTALSIYLGNIYILDKKAGILKFVASQNGFAKNEYFKTPPDLSNSQSMSIDGSVWILLKDGKIFKFTKGEKDNLEITGLPNPLKNPGRILTDREIDNFYILDNGNARLIKFAKTGTYQKQYYADILQNAKDIEILEKDQKALILSNGKIWEITL